MAVLQGVFANDLRDFVDLNLARRLELAETLSPEQVAGLKRFNPEAAWECIAGGTAVFGGTKYPANHIVGMGLYGAVTRADLDRVEEFYRSRGVPCEIVVSPLADRSLLEALGTRNYRLSEFNSVLIQSLHRVESIQPADNISIERVTAATAAVWNRVVAQGFAEFGPLPENTFLPFATLAGSLNFLARVDGIPAGGGMGAIVPEAGIAALFGTSTLRVSRPGSTNRPD